jgi:anti-sigma factor RsiW
VNCTAVRDLLPEHVLGVTGPHDASGVERHIAVCAACRKEAKDLGRAAAVLAFTLQPAEPAADLEDRIVNKIHASGGRVRHLPRPRRRGVALAVAAALVLSGLGLGALVAKRASPEQQGAATANRGANALQAFKNLIQSSELTAPGTEAFLGNLVATDGDQGNGAAMTLVAPNVDDRAIVIVTGLHHRRPLLPYRVWLLNGRGTAAFVGRITTLDAGGGATIARSFARDLAPFDRAVVRDDTGGLVLSGSLGERANIASHAP